MNKQTDYTTQAQELVAQMTLEEKASLCSGNDFWHTKAVERLGVPSIMLTDGPHGLRKQKETADHLGINDSEPATCFPTAAATACSFDTALMREIGTAIGEECQLGEVAVVLGPGVNTKRSPLCGRNFEYFSEDPYLAGALATAMIQGIQSEGVGACIKHFALNSQETKRMASNSIADERAKRELYLTSFELPIKQAQPWMVMSSYNQIDGTYASDNKQLLTTILRSEWGFEGAVVSDWGGVNIQEKAVAAGNDLEMPFDGGHHDQQVVAAARQGTLAETDLDTAATRMVALALKAQALAQAHQKDAEVIHNNHHLLARRAAAESCVLLKNEDQILPLSFDQSVAVIGRFAKEPRYQGSGSSKIVPTRMESVVDAFDQSGIAYDYAPGYSLERFAPADQELINEACKVAEGKDLVLIFAGLPDECESEGFDRSNLAMPAAHTKLIEAVSAANPNVAVVLQLGAPVVMPWQDKVKAIVVAYLGGQACGGGCFDVITGAVNPSGCLAETWPVDLADTPCASYYPSNSKIVEYRESIYVGYRYFDTCGRAPAWPFGFGLSYTTFEYSDLTLSKGSFAAGDTLEARFVVTNTGQVAGATVAQLYVGREQGAIYRAAKELKGFAKVFLEPGQSKEMVLPLDERSFAYYHALDACWALEGGSYRVLVGSSSATADLPLSAEVAVEGDGKEAAYVSLRDKAPEYYSLAGGEGEQGMTVADASFEAVLGRPLPKSVPPQKGNYTLSSTLDDIKDTWIGRTVIKQVSKHMTSLLAGNEDVLEMSKVMLFDLPLRALVLFSNGAVSPSLAEGIVAFANGKPFAGLSKVLRKK